MVHSIPLSLLNGQSAKEAYESLLKNVEHYNAHEWLAFVQHGFSGNKQSEPTDILQKDSMSEQKMLVHILHIVLLEIRAKAYESGDNRTFYIAGILHNVPLRFLGR
ncbi:hypothetical protein [Pinibacter aurantiacus]|uniref:Uncharacterized protein n=1 Tax=Pinibacter aurantiacus TaxID=2851599 RepID=A0A9E2SCK8_9BACT|nr:hypothetical protein [Pinibacter aurantiacus]MBV4360608.1 hypothetical protein [Pinibacter aurantiacus]